MAGSRKACDITRGCPLVLSGLLENSPSPGAVSIGGRLRAHDDDSHGFSLEVGVRVGPHIGVIFISGEIRVKVMWGTLVMGPGLVI